MVYSWSALITIQTCTAGLLAQCYISSGGRWQIPSARPSLSTSLFLRAGLSGGASSRQPSWCQSSCVTPWSSASVLRQSAITVKPPLNHFVLLQKPLYVIRSVLFVAILLNYKFILNISTDRQTDRQMTDRHSPGPQAVFGVLLRWAASAVMKPPVSACELVGPQCWTERVH